MKINLILSRSNWTSFHQPAFTELISDYFDIVYVEDQISDRDNSILVSNLTQDCWYTQLHGQGYPILLDLLWGIGPIELDNSFKLSNPNWFWYAESLLYKNLGYDGYIPNRQYAKLALMPMGLQKASHDMLFDRVEGYLDQFHWSYIERAGKYLPNDLPPQWTARSGSTGQHQRHFNPIWYDDTYFSLVSETTESNDFPLHITEKTFKPIAFHHPFLIWGQAGVLAHLRSQGFETYDNLFDESYDQELDKQKRLDIIIDNIKEFKQIKYDGLTNKKIQHNHQRFFDHAQIKVRIKQEIVDPIVEFFEKTRHS